MSSTPFDFEYQCRYRAWAKIGRDVILPRRHNNNTEVTATLRDYQTDTSTKLFDNVTKDHISRYFDKEGIPPGSTFHHVDHIFGSGKTRLACRFLKMYSDYIRDDSSKGLCGRVLLSVPDAVVPAWIEEMNKWGIAYLIESDYVDSRGNPVPERYMAEMVPYFWMDKVDFGHRADRPFHIERLMIRNADVIIVPASKLSSYMEVQVKQHKYAYNNFSLVLWDEFDTANVDFKTIATRYRNVVGLSATYKHPANMNGFQYIKYEADTSKYDLLPKTQVSNHKILYKITERINGVFKNTRFADLFKEGNYAESLAELGVSNVRDINGLINHVTAEYQSEMASLETSLPTAKDPEAVKAKIKDLEDKIAEIKRRVSENMEMCSICNDPFQDKADHDKHPVACARCQICFHTSCILRWYSVGEGNPTCPFCKKDLDLGSMIHIDREAPPPVPVDPNAETIFPNRTASIVEALQMVKKDTVDKGVNPRLLIVNQSNENTDLGIILKVMPSLVVGDIYTDKGAVKAFRDGEIDVITLNSWQDSAGLHIPETTQIIISAKVTEAQYEQIVHRAHRVGSTEDTTIYQCVSV